MITARWASGASRPQTNVGYIHTSTFLFYNPITCAMVMPSVHTAPAFCYSPKNHKHCWLWFSLVLQTVLSMQAALVQLNSAFYNAATAYMCRGRLIFQWFATITFPAELSPLQGAPDLGEASKSRCLVGSFYQWSSCSRGMVRILLNAHIGPTINLGLGDICML